MSGAAWTNAPVILYHGTLFSAAQDILNNSINISRCQKRSDFSQGFYTTTSRSQAVNFANRRYNDAKTTSPSTTEVAAILSWNVDRNMLGTEDNLVFIRPDDDYWRFVSFCRNGVKLHKTKGYYDIVYGPVNTNLQKRRVLPDSDQISFHTNHAISILQSAQPKCDSGNPQLKA